MASLSFFELDWIFKAIRFVMWALKVSLYTDVSRKSKWAPKDVGDGKHGSVVFHNIARKN